MKKMMAISLATCLAFSATFNSYAEIISNVSSWAEPSMKIAYNRNFIEDEAFEKSLNHITREEFCGILVNLYEDVMNEKIIITEENVFTDTNNEHILAAVQVGLMVGVSGTEFAPNDLLTREQLAVYLVNVLEVLNVDLTPYAEDSPFPDISNLPMSTIDDINKLYGVKVLSGNADGTFSPERKVTVEEAVMSSINTLWCYETTRNHQILNYVSIEDAKVDIEQVFTDEQLKMLVIDEKEVYIGQTTEEIIEVFGNPKRIDSTVYNLDRYIYHDNYNNYFFVTFVDGCVGEIFVPTDDFKYLDFDGEINRNNLLKYFNTNNDKDNLIISDDTKATIYIDYNGNSTGILLQDEEFITGKHSTITLSLTELSVIEPSILDILHVKRVEAGVPILEEDKKLKSVATAHASEMWWTEKAVYVGVDGKNPFQRIADAGIEYTMATELVDSQYGDIVNFYENMISSPANFATIVSPQYKNVGLGVMQKDYIIYMVIDLCN